MTQLKSLAHPEWPYEGTPWAWRGFTDMLSLSHWGLHPVPQAKHSRAWYDEVRNLPNHYDQENVFGVFRRLNFGDLP